MIEDDSPIVGHFGLGRWDRPLKRIVGLQRGEGEQIPTFGPAHFSTQQKAAPAGSGIQFMRPSVARGAFVAEGQRAVGQKTLVFSQFTMYLDIIEAVFNLKKVNYARLDGVCSFENRQSSIDQFQKGDLDVFLLSMKAGLDKGWILCGNPISETSMNSGNTQTQTRRDTQTHRHIETQTHGHTDTQTHRHTDTQTHRHTDNFQLELPLLPASFIKFKVQHDGRRCLGNIESHLPRTCFAVTFIKIQNY